MTARAFISGCAGVSFSAEEEAFLAQANPWGLILFRRNIGTPDEVRALTDRFRDIAGRADAPVLIDQEGGRVQRMGPPHWPRYPAARRYCAIPDGAALSRTAALRLAGRVMADDLRKAGITVNCAPVLDVPAPGSHDIVGDRAFGDSAGAVALHARAFAEGLLAGGVLPVIKHMPGHGRARADSHVELPVVEAGRAELEAEDFAPFRALFDMPLAMSAHVVFTALDPERPATVSPKVVEEIMRGHMGFDGLIMSDDLSMQALSGSLRERAEATFAAGLDMALHCNGNLEEARQVAEAAPLLAGRALQRAEAALGRLGASSDFDPVDGRGKLAGILALAGWSDQNPA